MKNLNKDSLQFCVIHFLFLKLQEPKQEPERFFLHAFDFVKQLTIKMINL